MPSDPIYPDETLWRLRKGDREAVCVQGLHPLGLELRLEVNGEVYRTQVAQSVDAARELAAGWRDAMLAVGWVDAADH